MNGVLERELEALVARYHPEDDELKKAVAAVLRRRKSAKKLEGRKAQMAQFMLERQRELDAMMLTAMQRAETDPENLRGAVVARNRGVSVTEAARAIMPDRTSQSTIKRLVREFDFFVYGTPAELAQAKANPDLIPKRGLGRGKWFME